jgi:hypothetical protein
MLDHRIALEGSFVIIGRLAGYWIFFRSFAEIPMIRWGKKVRKKFLVPSMKIKRFVKVFVPNRARNNYDRNPPGESAWTHGINVPKFTVPNLTPLNFQQFFKVWGYKPWILEHFPREFTRIFRADSGRNCSESDWVTFVEVYRLSKVILCAGYY